MIYSYRSYELVINYNSMTGQYEGYCNELNIWLSSKSKDGLEYSFRERVNGLGVLK